MIGFKNFINESADMHMPELFDALENKYTNKLDGVHFSNMPEVSFNPSPSHHDPLGVYVFHRSYLLSKTNVNGGFYSNKYQHIIRPTAKAVILDLDMSEDMASDILTKMGIPPEYLHDEGTYHNSRGEYTIGHKFWGSMERFRNENNLSKNSSWNTLFRKAGYNTIVDSGNAIIHSNEPYQIAYLEAGTFKVVETFTRNSSKKLIKDIIDAFPDWRARTGKSHYREPSLNMTKTTEDGNEVSILVTWQSHDNVTVKIYGYDEDFLERYEDYSSIVDDISEFISGAVPEDRPTREPTDSMIKYSAAFGFKRPKKEDGEYAIVRKYRDKTEGDLPILVAAHIWDGELTIRMYSNRSYFWKNYHYTSEEIPVDENYVEATNKAFDSIQNLIDKDLESNDFEKEAKAELANKHLKFYRDKVFDADNA